MNNSVLLVEGSELYREFITDFFKQREFSIIASATYIEATAAIQINHYDIVIADFFCNGQDGDNFCSSIQNSGNGSTGLIIMSDQQNSAIEKRIRRLSPAFYFVKPFLIENLYAVVLKICDYLGKKDLSTRKSLHTFTSHPLCHERAL